MDDWLEKVDDILVGKHGILGKHIAVELNNMPIDMVKTIINFTIFERNMKTLNTSSFVFFYALQYYFV